MSQVSADKLHKAICLICCFGFSSLGLAKPADDVLADKLLGLSLEELVNMEVTSVSRRAQSIFDAAAAISVVTSEDIRRSGATSIIDALRLVPGFQASRTNANNWSVGIRGFNQSFANKLLVLVDGRSVYSPLFSGANWDVLDLILEDIERIEVLRGPGAAMWGSNGVNGVINVITRHSDNTQGTLLSFSAGNQEKNQLSWRYGDEFSGGSYRSWFKHIEKGDGVLTDGSDADDGWTVQRFGGRLDWESGHMLDAQYYSGNTKPELFFLNQQSGVLSTNNPDREQQGGHLLWRYNWGDTDDISYRLQGYVDYYKSLDPRVGEKRVIYSLDFEQGIKISESQHLVWGIEGRISDHELLPTDYSSYDSNDQKESFFSAFIQDEFELVPEKLRLTLSSRFENNPYSGFEWQPDARLFWRPKEKQTVWMAISRAVRTPTIIEREIDILTPRQVAEATISGIGLLPVYLRAKGNTDMDSESLLAFNGGFKHKINSRFNYDVSLFLHLYDDLVASSTLVGNCLDGDSFSSTYGICISTFNSIPNLLYVNGKLENGMDAETWGGELSAEWKGDGWKVKGNYSLLQTHAHASKENASASRNEALVEGISADHQVSITAGIDLAGGFELDSWLRFQDNLREPDIPSFWNLDLRLGWQLDGIEMSLVGQNLLSDSHTEFAEQVAGFVPVEVKKGFYFQMRVYPW